MSRKTNQQPQEKYADNDDDFIDYILQLDNNVSPTNVSNISVSDSCTRPLMPTSSTSLSTSSITPQPPSSSPNMFLQNRYRPRLQMIREGNSGDYTYCYSSTEIAQIYENWQANENTNRIGNKSLANVSSSSSSQASSGMHPFPHQTHLFEYHQQPQQTSTTVHQHPMVLGNNVYPSSTTSPPFNATQSNFVSIGPVDHQPYANNRLSHSPEDNYVNTIAAADQVLLTSLMVKVTAFQNKMLLLVNGRR
ncbi:unnamed protein product [Orchesella dallaii]|uniref:Uncharacterized protein n=1 Tax=Orchesella dallaii TaxID=48710 RepID=A0ABP1RAW2_9HEXA